MDYNSIELEFQKDNSCLNKLYEDVISTGPDAFSSYEEYSKVICFLVNNYVCYNDYLHSNNLLQAFRINSNEKGISISNCDWYRYYSIKIYSKRSIKYYLDNPQFFWEAVYKLSGSSTSDYTERLDNLLVDTLEFYKSEYVNYPEFLHDSMVKFVNYYFINKQYSPTVTAHLKELRKLVAKSTQKEVEEIYNDLPSQTIGEIELPSNVSKLSEEYKNYLADKAKEEDLFGDIILSDEDRKKVIMVVGDDPFLHNTKVIFGIGKEYNISKEQFEFYTDYDKIKQDGERIVSKTQYRKDKYIGIIFGSNPHSTSGNEGASSLIAKVSSEPGFPYYVVCRQNNDSGKPKITKTNFKNALRDIILKYKSQ